MMNTIVVDKMINQLLKVQGFLCKSMMAHKSQLKSLKDSLQTIFMTKQALEKKQQDKLNLLVRDYKAQHQQVLNTIGQSELYHIKI